MSDDTPTDEFQRPPPPMERTDPKLSVARARAEHAAAKSSRSVKWNIGLVLTALGSLATTFVFLRAEAKTVAAAGVEKAKAVDADLERHKTEATEVHRVILGELRETRADVRAQWRAQRGDMAAEVRLRAPLAPLPATLVKGTEP